MELMEETGRRDLHHHIRFLIPYFLFGMVVEMGVEEAVQVRLTPDGTVRQERPALLVEF